MPKGQRLKTNDIALLKQMQKEWRFIYTEGDVATVESEIILCHNGKQVFRSGIVLSKARQGLQNRQYGWLEASPNGILTDQCKKFEKIYFPVFIK
jgi:hypothetical protein